MVRETVLCTQDEPEDQCYFRFRDKYRTLPGLAYSIGVESNSNKVALLNEFYASIPPLIAIQSFNFDKAKSQGLMLANEGEYVGSVNFNIYGRGITMEESNEISQLLTTACFGSGSSMEMNLSGALEKIEEKLKLVGASSLSDSKVATMSNLLELKDSFLESAASYNELSPYNQMIKKFEIYRELKNLSLCTI
ncbi:MAG: hypothetical protein Q4B28_07955 [bacterium]|nr:hypothetical protein [bacterium]